LSVVSCQLSVVSEGGESVFLARGRSRVFCGLLILLILVGVGQQPFHFAAEQLAFESILQSRSGILLHQRDGFGEALPTLLSLSTPVVHQGQPEPIEEMRTPFGGHRQ
jgi:hypothetical protein